MAREVVCATTDPSGPNDCRCIEEIGYEFEFIDSGGTKTPEEVHNDIKNEGRRYFVEHNNTETDLIAAEKHGTKYVRTEPNDTEDDNLLELGDC